MLFYLILSDTVGKRAFPVSGSTDWNDLPLHVASAPSLAVFRQGLRTFLFSRSYQDTFIWQSVLSGHLWSLQQSTLFRPR